MSILSLQEVARSVIIIPESVINAGWKDVAFKIESFIKCDSQLNIPVPPRVTEMNYPYAKAVQESK